MIEKVIADFEDEVATDAELIERAKAGEVDALTFFINRHRQNLVEYCRREVENNELAENMTVESLFEFCRDLDKIRDNKSSVRYLFKIAYRNCIDWCRKENRRRAIAEMIPILNENEAEMYYGLCEDEI